MHENATQCQDGNQVGDSHQGIHAICKIPYHLKTHDAANEYGSDVGYAVGNDPLVTFQIFYGTLAIITPSQYGGEGKGGQSEGEQWGAHKGNLGESFLGEGGTALESDVGISQHAADDDNTREGADDHGVPEGAGG